MTYLFYLRLIGLTAGTLVYFFLLALILGHRRPRLFERLLFFLVLSLSSLFMRADCLTINARIQYSITAASPRTCFSGLFALRLVLILPLVWHVHYAYRKQIRRSQPSICAKALLGSICTVAAFA